MCFFSQQRNLLYSASPATITKAIATIETPNIFWCPFVKLVMVRWLDSASLLRWWSILSEELAVLWASEMASWTLSMLLCLSFVPLVATVDRCVNSCLIASNSLPRWCPVFLSISCFRFSNVASIAVMRFDSDSIAFATCWRKGSVSKASLNTRFVRSLIVSDSARWSLKDEASRKTSSLSFADVATVSLDTSGTLSPWADIS
mmetsp:Transcript_100538/g.283542  ORF Transcript_100538/g.283542 Transcript_100538/m.283542 type:complete len:203 (-) Transcript_100538:861-1469(-)